MKIIIKCTEKEIAAIQNNCNSGTGTVNSLKNALKAYLDKKSISSDEDLKQK